MASASASPAPADVAATSPPARPGPPADSASPDRDTSDAPASASASKDDRQRVPSDGELATDPSLDQASVSKKRKRSPDDDSSETPTKTARPPLPAGEEVPPPLPNEEPPAPEDDGWDAHWDHSVAAYYFHNRYTGVTQWENPRVPPATSLPGPPAPAAPPAAPGTTTHTASSSALGSPPRKTLSAYNPAIHGDYDANADYAREYEHNDESMLDPDAAAAAHAAALAADASGAYAQSAAFNRFTGRFQAADLGPDQHNDESKSKRQLNAYFDVDAAANSHNGMSLKAERQNKRLTKKELKAFKEKAARKKEEKRRAWLRD